MPPANKSAALNRIKAAVAKLKADGGTAIYDALGRAYQLLAAGGRTFDARNTTLTSAFKEIRGYQQGEIHDHRGFAAHMG